MGFIVPTRSAGLAIIALTACWPQTSALADCGDSSLYVHDDALSEEERCQLEAWAESHPTSALVVTIGGRTIFELVGDQSGEQLHIMSVTKSVASLAVGRMLLDGELESVDLKLADLFPEWNQGRKKDISLRHLLTHSTGLQDLPNAGVEIEPAPDVIQLALAAELSETPGEVFRYNNKASNLLAAVVERITGEKIDDYLGRTVFADLEITEYDWLRDSAGNPYVMAGLFLNGRDLAKIGQLMTRLGDWRGSQIVDRDFIEQSITPQREDFQRIGFLWWMVEGRPDIFQANGWLGQWLVGFADSDAVAVRLVDRSKAPGGSEGGGDFLRLVTELLGSAQPKIATRAWPGP